MRTTYLFWRRWNRDSESCVPQSFISLRNTCDHSSYLETTSFCHLYLWLSDYFADFQVRSLILNITAVYHKVSLRTGDEFWVVRDTHAICMCIIFRPMTCQSSIPHGNHYDTSKRTSPCRLLAQGAQRNHLKCSQRHQTNRFRVSRSCALTAKSCCVMSDNR